MTVAKALYMEFAMITACQEFIIKDELSVTEFALEFSETCMHALRT